MIKWILSPLLFIGVCFSHDHIPDNTNLAVPGGLFRVLKRYSKKVTLLGEFEGGPRYGSHMYTSLKLGAYRKISRSQKFGFFLFNKTGQRHREDWILNDDLEWEWFNSSNRMEQEIHLDYTIRTKTNFLVPLVFSFKPEVSYNLYNDDAIFIFTPTMSYFRLRGRRPKYSFHTKLPVYIPINFEGETLYKFGLYQSLLYHMSRRYILGLSFNHLVESWIDSEEFKEKKPLEDYLSQDKTTTISLDFILKI